MSNGIALSPTSHLAFDKGLIYLNERLEMALNEPALAALEGAGLAEGVEHIRASLGPIHCPAEIELRPSVEFIEQANRIRGIV